MQCTPPPRAHQAVHAAVQRSHAFDEAFTAAACSHNEDQVNESTRMKNGTQLFIHQTVALC